MANIHQEVTFATSPETIFRTLVDAAEFAKATGAPATGNPIEGETFTAFGGHITGRHIELVPGKRVVQAWRAKTWPVGKYSLVTFELHQDAAATRLVFDHDGFPEDAKEHLAAGWESNYWVALRALK